MLREGTHKCKVVGCYTGESSEKKTPFFGIEFETIEDQESIYWNAYLSNTKFKKSGKEVTLAEANLETLIQLGFKGKRISDLSDESKGFLDLFDIISDTISVVIEHEEYTTDDGEMKTAARVKFVNVGYGNMNKFDHKQAVAKFKSLTFDGELMSLRKKVSAPKKAEPESEAEKPATKPEASADYNDDDIPF